MNSHTVISLLFSRAIWPAVVAGLCLGHAAVQAQTASSSPTSSGAVASATDTSASSQGTASTAPMQPAAAPSFTPAPPPQTISPSAQSAAPTTAPAAASLAKPHAPAHKPTGTRDTRPTWAELSRTQQEALRPLAQIWPNLSELHKRKWLVLSQNYDEFSPQEQHKLQQRMSDWASLTARERAQARLHFAEVQQLPGDERRAKWEAYQALSDEQRRKLADDILLAPPRGAAVASRPVTPGKLTQPPAPKPDQVLQPRIDTDQVQPKTLLPHFLQGTSTR